LGIWGPRRDQIPGSGVKDGSRDNRGRGKEATGELTRRVLSEMVDPKGDSLTLDQTRARDRAALSSGLLNSPKTGRYRYANVEGMVFFGELRPGNQDQC